MHTCLHCGTKVWYDGERWQHGSSLDYRRFCYVYGNPNTVATPEYAQTRLI